MIPARIAERWFGSFTKRDRSNAYKLANSARDARDWPRAAEQFAALVARWPREAAAWVQFGHALKESGRLHDAEGAYVEALRLEPNTVDTELHLFHLRRRIALAEPVSDDVTAANDSADVTRPSGLPDTNAAFDDW